MSDDKKSPFSEETVVHQSDVNTVIRPVERKPVLPKTAPVVAREEASETTNVGETESFVAKSLDLMPTPIVERKTSRPAHAGQKHLRLIVGGLLSVLVAVGLTLRHGLTKSEAHATPDQTTEMASSAPPPPPASKFKFSEATDSNDVLAKFEKASARAQQRTFEPSR